MVNYPNDPTHSSYLVVPDVLWFRTVFVSCLYDLSESLFIKGSLYTEFWRSGVRWSCALKRRRERRQNIFDVDDHISQLSVAKLPGMAQLQGTSLVPSSERLDMKPASLPAKNVSWNMCTTPSALASVECVYWRVAGHAMNPRV
jgi:hypothetical protein